MAADPQQDVIDFLAQPASYDAAGPVERLSTHISHVFLCGERAYKLKRAVRFSYLDFSTVELRRAACNAEIAVNRRTAPDLYLGVAPVRRDAAGRLRLGAVADAGAGAAEDWVVVMRRFGQEALFDHMAVDGRLTRAHMVALADAVAAFHDRAEVTPGFGGSAAMAALLDGNAAEIARAVPAAFEATAVQRLDAAMRRALAAAAPRLDERRAAGLVRHCHGDLHLRNVALVDGRPTPFDAIEFDPALSHIDVLYDFAFLLMDCEHRSLRGFANAALNRYLAMRPDYGGLALLPLFMACRAAIRAHVSAAAGGAAEARSYFSLAEALLAPPAPRLIAVGGLSGSGKSTVAEALAPEVGAVPGAVVLRSDVIRKRLFGLDPLARLPEAAYAPEVTQKVYAAMRDQAAAALAGGHSAVADAVHARADERAAIAAVAAAAGARFDGIWLDLPLETRVSRIRGRAPDASDATAEVAAAQENYDRGTLDWTRVAAGGSLPDSLGDIRSVLFGAAR